MHNIHDIKLIFNEKIYIFKMLNEASKIQNLKL
jgi:hypothetical protein